MLKLYHAPNTRSVRVVWLLEELGLDYELLCVDFRPSSGFFTQNTPLRKIPVLEDGGVVMCESGAIIEYILETYGGGRLAPAPGSPQRASFLQWLHFSEGTAYAPIGIIVWHTLYKGDADRVPEVVEDARVRAHAGFDFVESALEDGDYLLGSQFCAADIMMGFTLGAARLLEILDDRHPRLVAYVDRLQQRPAFQRAIAV